MPIKWQTLALQIIRGFLKYWLGIRLGADDADDALYSYLNKSNFLANYNKASGTIQKYRLTHWSLTASWEYVNIGGSNELLMKHTKPLPEPYWPCNGNDHFQPLSGQWLKPL